MTFVDVFVGASQQFVLQMAAFLPKLIVAVLIWVIGKYCLGLAVRLIKKIHIRGTKLDQKIIDSLVGIALPLGKLILVLIILDYLGIGRTVIGAFTNGLSLAIAIALGLAFGRALEKDAVDLLTDFKKHWKK